MTSLLDYSNAVKNLLWATYVKFKDVRAKIFHSMDFYFFKFLLQSDGLLVPEIQKMGITVFVSDIKRVENHPDFDKLSHIIQHGLQWFIV